MKAIAKLITILSIVLVVPAIIMLVLKAVKDGELEFDLPFDEKDFKAKKKDSLKKVKTKVEDVTKSVVDKVQDLSERQNEVYDFIMKNGEVEMSRLSSKFSSVSPRTLRRDLTKLVSAKLVNKKGSTKNTKYSLK
ncbi:DeoR family transcriptional regulator [Candidatus Dojkabacteria bacterium]|uniref:DeoR family transcriptional regulator n=1 Tax=Candidatus Dojkabacteria bacterium TaxID=2099670 RepID=A0A955I8E7_9BACT|nr:DeoR family transcriptional regulator [Candidatus Dojkabacteria bacterium]